MAQELGGDADTLTLAEASTHSKKPWAYIGLATLILIISASLYLYLSSRKSNNATVGVGCLSAAESSDLKVAGSAILNDDINKLQPIAHKIQKIPGYQKDPSCMYVMVNFAIITGNSVEAKNYFKVYQKIDTKELSSSLGSEIFSEQTMQTDINSMQAKSTSSFSGSFSKP